MILRSFAFWHISVWCNSTHLKNVDFFHLVLNCLFDFTQIRCYQHEILQRNSHSTFNRMKIQSWIRNLWQIENLRFFKKNYVLQAILTCKWNSLKLINRNRKKRISYQPFFVIYSIFTNIYFSLFLLGKCLCLEYQIIQIIHCLWWGKHPLKRNSIYIYILMYS